MESVAPTIDTLYRSLDLIGVVLNGIIGGTIARRRNFDIIGFVFLALFSATAGGVVRDMVISDGPAAATSDPLCLMLSPAGAISTSSGLSPSRRVQPRLAASFATC